MRTEKNGMAPSEARRRKNIDFPSARQAGKLGASCAVLCSLVSLPVAKWESESPWVLLSILKKLATYELRLGKILLDMILF